MSGAQPENSRRQEDDDESRPCGDVGGDDLALEITHERMDAAVSTGSAVPLELADGWLTGYQSAWWVLSELGWIRITDEETLADIDYVAARLAEVAEDASGGASPDDADL